MATIEDEPTRTYAGHLLFGGTFPRFRIFQIYVDPDFRGQHVASRLLQALISEGEGKNYLSISARVADDLAANAFWDHAGFEVLRKESGGATTGRRINIRIRTLRTPTLFAPDAAAGPLAAGPVAAARTEQPIYSLDLNVLLDIIQDRPRADDARRLLTAAMSGKLRLFVTQEFLNEVRRAAHRHQPDPLLRVVIALPRFPTVPDHALDNLINEIDGIIFPTRRETGGLRPSERSDITHLAVTIHHRAAGFVTSDKRILRNREALRERYGIDVLGPAELAELFLPQQWSGPVASAVEIKGDEIVVAEMEEGDRAAVERLLGSCRVPTGLAALALSAGPTASPRRRLWLRAGTRALAFGSWDPPTGAQRVAEAFVAAESEATFSDFSCEYLFDAMMRDASRCRPAVIRLIGDLRNADVLEAAVACGFRVRRPANREDVPEKLCIGGIVTPLRWPELRNSIARLTGDEVPEDTPTYAGPDTIMPVTMADGRSLQISICDFETRYGPMILMCNGRPTVVIPIKRKYADELLGTGEQTGLFPLPQASLRNQRLYLSSPRTLSVIAPGSIVLFYESLGRGDGRAAVVACARVFRTALRAAGAMISAVPSRGVLTSGEIERLSGANTRALIYFDQLMKFTIAVPLKRLRALGCADGANFITARNISYLNALSVIEEGMPSVALY